MLLRGETANGQVVLPECRRSDSKTGQEILLCTSRVGRKSAGPESFWFEVSVSAAADFSDVTCVCPLETGAVLRTG
jgi:hypothetical protein